MLKCEEILMPSHAKSGPNRSNRENKWGAQLHFTPTLTLAHMNYPLPYLFQCDAIVNKTKAIMDFIEKRVNPKGICRVLGICKLEETELDNMSKMKFVRKWKKSGKKSPKQRMRSLCRLCKATLKFIRENKGTLSTTEVKAGLQKRCLEITGNRGAEKVSKAGFLVMPENTRR